MPSAARARAASRGLERITPHPARPAIGCASRGLAILSHKGGGRTLNVPQLSSPLVGEESEPQKARPIGLANLVRGDTSRQNAHPATPRQRREGR